jgi:hypothetical protein
MVHCLFATPRWTDWKSQASGHMLGPARQIRFSVDLTAFAPAVFLMFAVWLPPALLAQPVAPPPTITLIQITAPSTTTYTGQSLQLTATAVHPDGTTSDVTRSAAWASSDSTIAAVNGLGSVAATSAGTATLSASYQGKSATITLTVVA